MKNTLFDEIKHFCDEDVYEIGFASLSGLLDLKWTGYYFGISLMRKIDCSIIERIRNGPTTEYYNLYNSINAELNAKTEEITSLLKKNNIKAAAIKATLDDSEIDFDYCKTLRYSLSHKMVATQAGLGWIGKTDLLISRRFGPRIRLASVLTSSRITEVGVPINRSLCGDCNLCVINCPAQAANGFLWDSTVDRDVFYNPFKCRQYAREISATRIQKEISLCGICISVCPIGKN